MATSASVNTNTYGGRKITLTVEETGTSIENNTSTVKWTLTSGTSSTYHSVYDITAWVGGTTDSNKVYGPKTADWSSRAFPCKDGSTSGTLTIQHNADGTASPLTFRLRGSVYNNNPQNYDGSITLTTIPRASSFTISKTSGGSAATSWNLGEALYVNITRASSSFTHKVYFVVNNSGNQVISNSAGTSANTTLANSLAQYIPSSSATATIYVDTYSGTTKIGTATKTFTINVPSSVVPSISSVTKSDTAGYLSTYNAYVQGKSNLRVQTSASGNYSSITNYTVQLKNSGGTILNTKTGNDVTFSNISYTGTITVLVTVTDSRNRTATNSSTITVATYNNPTITTFNAERRNNDATVTITYNASITNINSRNVNAKTFRIYKRQKGTSSWGNAIVTYTGGYTYSGSTTTSCDENYGWEFKLEAIDSFTTTTKTDEVGTAFELMNWKADGTALALGKVSETSNSFEANLDSVFYKKTVNRKSEGDAFWQVNRTDINTTVGLGIGGSGARGIYDWTHGKWLFHTTATNSNVFIDGREWDLGTENTADTWVPVMTTGKLQHRAIPTAYNSTSPTLTGLTVTGNISSLYRKQFSLTAKSSDDAPQYFLLAQLPGDSSGNHTALTIQGHLGTFTSRINIDLAISNRNGINVYGAYVGHPDAWTGFEFNFYTQSDNSVNIYLKRKARYTCDVVLDLYGQQATLYNSTTAVTPTGTITRTYDGNGFPNVSHTRAGTGIVTRTGGATLVSSSWARYGKVCSVVISIKATSNISVGSNAFTGTINSSYLPQYKASGVTFNASSCLVGVIETNGNITIRVTGATFSNGNTADVSFTYVMA